MAAVIPTLFCELPSPLLPSSFTSKLTPPPGFHPPPPPHQPTHPAGAIVGYIADRRGPEIITTSCFALALPWVVVLVLKESLALLWWRFVLLVRLSLLSFSLLPSFFLSFPFLPSFLSFFPFHLIESCENTDRGWDGVWRNSVLLERNDRAAY